MGRNPPLKPCYEKGNIKLNFSIDHRINHYWITSRQLLLMKLHNKEVIIDLLTHKEHLRDNDQALIANIWWRELVTQGKDKSTAFEFLKVFSEGKLSNPESIRRARQKIQEENPELRGDSYWFRHKEEKRFRQEEIN